MDAARPFIIAASLADVQLAGEGLEFTVFRANSLKYGDVALRVPKSRYGENVNDPYIDSKQLLVQELRIYEHLQNTRIPAPRPCELVEVGDGVASLASYVESDGSDVSQFELGRMLGLIHSVQPPSNMYLAAQEGVDALETLPRRIIRRWEELSKLVPSVPALPTESKLRGIMDGLARFPSRLLHLDMRGANLRVRGGNIIAVTDWSNSLIGPAAIDLYRVIEFERPDQAFLDAYGQSATLPDLTDEEETLLRLDAAVMLALVFLSEAPDPERAKESVHRVTSLASKLNATVAA